MLVVTVRETVCEREFGATEGDCVMIVISVGETVCEREFGAAALAMIVIVGELEMLEHKDELEPNVLEPDKVIDTLIESCALPVIERGVTSMVGVSVTSGVGDGVKVEEVLLSMPEPVGVGPALDVILALPPKKIVDDGVSDGDDVRLSVTDGVDSEVGNPLSLPDGEAEGVGSALGVILALPPTEIVDSGVEDGLEVINGVKRGVGEGLALSVDVAEGVGSALGVILALPTTEIVDGGVADSDGVILGVANGVDSGVGELLAVIEPLSLPEVVTERVDTALGVSLALPPNETVDCDVVEGDEDCEGVGDVVASGVIDGDCEGV